MTDCYIKKMHKGHNYNKRAKFPGAENLQEISILWLGLHRTGRSELLLSRKKAFRTWSNETIYLKNIRHIPLTQLLKVCISVVFLSQKNTC